MSIRILLLVLALCVASTPLLAQQGAGDPLTVRTGAGVETFLVSDLDAAAAFAARDNTDRAAKNGVVPAPTPGFRLHASLVARTDAPGLLSDRIAGMGTEARIEAVDGAPGFWRVDLADLRTAAAVLTAIEALYPRGTVYLDVDRPKSLRRLPGDPMFGQQWHLRNTSRGLADINPEPAWDAGYTGQGVIVGVLEGGWQTNHPDLAANYNATASQSGGSSGHGTSVAGVIGAVANNGRGVVGGSYDAQISKQYFGSSTTTANAFGYRNDLNDIKNNSWGPSDDGTRHTIASVELNALINGTANGRGGLGEIYMWAAGNGGTGDRVEYDPYASSRHTIAVGAIGDQDNRASYNEKGSSMLVVAHSSGNGRGITTTDSGSGYTSGFGGTSSASPLGAAVVALMLDANPALTWRDVQGVLVHSSRKNDPADADWLVNGAGHDISYDYGFGAVEAAWATATAANWTPYGSEVLLDSGVLAVGQAIPDNDTTGLVRTFTVAQDVRIESVEVVINVAHNFVGDLFIKLTAPDGTNSVLAKNRSDSKNNYTNYILTSFRDWDEMSAGDWTLSISDRSSGTTGTWTDWRLKIYGNDGSGGPGLTLATSALYAGSNADFMVRHGDPGVLTVLAYGLQAGSTFVPQLGVTLGIANPQQGGSLKTSDAAGAASWTLPVPASVSGLTVYLQAAQPGRISNLLEIYVN